MSAVDAATQYVTGFCEGERIGEDTRDVLVLILEELITNTISHGRPDPASPIVVNLDRDGDHILLGYLDHGVVFDPLRDRPEPDLTATTERATVGGMGWPLILHFSDSVDYRREGDANSLHFVISVQAGKREYTLG